SDAAARLAAISQQAYNETVEDVSSAISKRSTGSCTLKNLRVRREWHMASLTLSRRNKLSASDRKAYIKAVQCLQSKLAKTPASVAPGAKTRYDDFVATHIYQTLTIHYTGNFLSWHRYYTWVYEEALRNECGYTGTQPFWDWGLTALTSLEKSPIFDGSDTSMSGNSVYQGARPDYALGASTGLPPLYLPAGTGGGCVTSGPFKDIKVNLGPVALDLPGGAVAGGGPGPGLAYNPRCLSCDLKSAVVKKFADYATIRHNIIKPTNINDFQMEMQGIPGTSVLGIHGAGHYGSGGDPGDDVFVS
ncbi:Di-copper centre-containing protein, partial [Coniochaeta ligniaria NRRL 30616]